MDGNQTNNAIEPLFYIIQPTNKKIPIGQNMQDIYHNKGMKYEVEETKVEEVVEIKNETIEDLKIEEPVEQTISAIQEDSLLVDEISQIEEDAQMDSSIDEQEEIDFQTRDLRMKLIRLSRYPAVVQKPTCELIINGESFIGQIESKRGEILKIKIDDEIRLVTIDEIEDVSVI